MNENGQQSITEAGAVSSRVQCPKCRHRFESFDACPRCGLILEKYFALRERRKLDKDNPARDGRSLRNIPALKSVLLVIIGLTIILVGVNYFAGNWTTHKQQKLVASIKEIKVLTSRNSFSQARDLLQNFGPESPIKKNLEKYIDHHESRAVNMEAGKRHFKQAIISTGFKDMAGASEKFENAFIYFKRINDPQLVALTCLNLGICYKLLHENQRALAAFEEAIRISRNHGFENWEAKALQGSGFLYAYLGQADMAFNCLQGSLSVYLAMNDKKGAVWDYIFLGLLENRKKPNKGRNYLELARDWIETIDDSQFRDEVGLLLNNLLGHKKPVIKLANLSPEIENL